MGTRRPKKDAPAGIGNALLGWELLRVSRRTATLCLSRFAFGGLLLGVLWLMWSADKHRFQAQVNSTEFSKKLSEFNAQFALTFFCVQLGVVMLLTPIFVAGSVFEERETRSGEVLLTTDLTRREVFYGKFLARTVQVMLVVAAGIPVLALTLLWGGVAPEFAMVGYTVTFFCIFSTGAMAASVAGGAETFRQAVLRTYGYVLVFDGLLLPASPFLVVWSASREVGWGLMCFGVMFVVLQIVVTTVALSHGLRWLRLAMLRQRRQVTAELAAQMAQRKPPVVEENPLLWKERFVGGEAVHLHEWISNLAVVIIGTLGLIGLVAGATAGSGWVGRYILPVLVAVAAGLAGFAATGSVVRERQKNTLIDLFMLPGGRTELLRAKLAGALWLIRWAALGCAVMCLFSIPSGTPLAGVPALLAASAALIGLSTTFGLWLSVRSRTVVSANATWLGAMAIYLSTTLLIADAAATSLPNESKVIYPSWGYALNPGLTWMGLTEPHEAPARSMDSGLPWEFHLTPADLDAFWASLLGVCIYSVAAMYFWFAAHRRFEREGRED